MNPLPPGQTGIRLRDAMVAQDVAGMLAQIPTLDRPHRLELLLGACFRDGRQDFAAAHLFVALEQQPFPDWAPLCQRLCLPDPDRSWDDLAAAYIATRQAPDRWQPEGGPLLADPLLHPFPDRSVADQLCQGVSGLALLVALQKVALYPAVALYYQPEGIHAMGPRPLLILAAYAADHSLKA